MKIPKFVFILYFITLQIHNCVYYYSFLCLTLFKCNFCIILGWFLKILLTEFSIKKLICCSFSSVQISTLAQGKPWDERKSPAQNYTGSFVSTNTNYSSNTSSSTSSYQSTYSSSEGYQSGGSYQTYNSPQFKDQKEAFFSKLQQENAGRRE